MTDGLRIAPQWAILRWAILTFTSQWDLSHPTFNLSLIVLWLEWMAASLKDPGSILGGGPKRLHDSFNFVFYIVGECISCAADTHLATDLTCKKLEGREV